MVTIDYTTLLAIIASSALVGAMFANPKYWIGDDENEQKNH